jgi:hypothetical protein
VPDTPSAYNAARTPGGFFNGGIRVSLRALTHLVLHLLVPAAIAKTWFGDNFRRAWLIMVAAMFIDVDHLLADPVYDPDRCSIGFHPLHQYPLIAVYALAAWWPKTRLLGIGLLVHLALDGIDCLWMHYEA